MKHVSKLASLKFGLVLFFFFLPSLCGRYSESILVVDITFCVDVVNFVGMD